MKFIKEDREGDIDFYRYHPYKYKNTKTMVDEVMKKTRAREKKRRRTTRALGAQEQLAPST